jgi:AraC family transcriptional regulator
VRARRANAVDAFNIGDCAAAIEEPRLAVSPRLLVAGLAERYDFHDGSATADQWRRFAPYHGRIAGQVGKAAYGTSYYTGADGNVEYLSGVEVADFSSVPRNFGLLCVPAQRCAVFFHGDHVSALRGTWTAIWNQWLPDLGYEVADAPFFERYAESFDPLTGLGGAEIWIPIR